MASPHTHGPDCTHDHTHGHEHTHAQHAHGHDDGHDHKHDAHAHQGGHGHHHHHHGAVANIKVAFFLNLAFTILELVGGLLTNSVAILSDALHDLGDSLSLGMSWYLERVSTRNRDQAYSYGYARFSVLGAFVNSVILIVGSIFVLQTTIPRLLHPETSDAKGMIVFALIGVAVNGFAALRLAKGHTLNERSVALHLLEDVLGWAAILIGSVVMLFVDVPILDPILSLCITAYVMSNVFKGLARSFRIFLQGTPHELPTEAVAARVKAVKGVQDVHDLHLWTLDGHYNVATLHVVVGAGTDMAAAEVIKEQVRATLKAMAIAHATIEMEDGSVDCELGDCSAAAHVVTEVHHAH